MSFPELAAVLGDEHYLRGKVHCRGPIKPWEAILAGDEAALEVLMDAWAHAGPCILYTTVV
jgi:hypothetical protein